MRKPTRAIEVNPSARSNMAIYDLIDADTMQERKIAALLRAGNDVAAKRSLKIPRQSTLSMS